jgi:hypothetical protein
MLAPIRACTAPSWNGSSSGAVPGVRVHEHQRELIAAEPNEDVVAPQRTLEPAAEQPEQIITDRVAEGVVDLFEAVEVDEQQGNRAGSGVIACVLVRERIEHFKQRAAIAQVGELVGDRLDVALLRELAQRCQRQPESHACDQKRCAGENQGDQVHVLDGADEQDQQRAEQRRSDHRKAGGTFVSLEVARRRT